MFGQGAFAGLWWAFSLGDPRGFKVAMRLICFLFFSDGCLCPDAPCKAALHLHVPRSSSRISPLMRYFNNGSFPFQRSEHKRNELIKKLVDPYMRLRAAFGMDEYAFERVWVETKCRGNSKRIYHLLMIFCDSYNCVLIVLWRLSIIYCVVEQ